MATLVYSDADGIDRTFAIGPEPIVVGRAQECAIRSADPRVSRMHARFFVAEGALWVEDLGSSNGIYVGTNKVQRAAVPTGEIVLIGSLMIRLLPPSGTLPPPMGLHGTLAQWLEIERKARAGVEEERDALARRVNEIHGEARQVRDAVNAHEQDATKLRDELTQLRMQQAKEVEVLRLEAAKARDAKVAAETLAGIETAAKLAASDGKIAELTKALEKALAAAAAPEAERKARDLADTVTTLTARVENAEKELATAQIRAQGAERELAAATTELTQLRETAVASGNQRVTDCVQRAEESERRALAADTMAKAMAKDVAEALRRAVDADLRTRTVSRELDGAHARAEAAEKREAERKVALRDAERRATEAESRLEEVRAELGGKLDRSERELAAERSSSMALVDRKTQIERELSDARSMVAQLGDKTEDEKLEAQLAEAKAAAKSAVKTAAGLEKRIEAGEELLRVANEARAAAEATATAATAALEEARARLAELESAAASHAASSTERDSAALARDERIAELTRKLEAVQREVDAAENVRQFAATTEREIAQLQRELRETKSKLAQVTLERDRSEAQLGDLREDSVTSHRRVVAPGPEKDPEATVQADLRRYTELVARSADLEVKLADAEARAAAQRRAQEDEPTNTGNALPIAFVEHLSVLEESIDSLRANMRAASDETAMMEPSESVVAVASAVSQAAEQIERARDALRVLTAMVGART